MAAQMTIDQAGLPPGVPGQARSDGLDTGALVTLTNTGGGQTVEFELLDFPDGDVTAEPSLAPSSLNVWTFSPTALRYGTYRIRLVVDRGLPTQTIQTRVFRIRTPNLGLAIPGWNESASPSGTRLNEGPTIVTASDDNEASAEYPAGDPRGWFPALRELILAVDTLVVGGATLQSAYNAGQTIATAAASPVDVQGAAAGQTNLLRLYTADVTATVGPLFVGGPTQGFAPNRWAPLLEAAIGLALAPVRQLLSEVAPEGVVTAPPGSICFVQTSPASADDGLWVKATGAGNTGWFQVGGGSSTVTVTVPIEAGQTISVGDAVSAAPTAGRCRRANANGGAPPLLGNFLGIASVGGTGPADSATILTCGPVGTGAGLTANAPVFLDVVTPGLVTSTPPAGAGNLALRIGWAWSATDYVLHVGEGTLLT